MSEDTRAFDCAQTKGWHAVARVSSHCTPTLITTAMTPALPTCRRLRAPTRNGTNRFSARVCAMEWYACHCVPGYLLALSTSRCSCHVLRYGDPPHPRHVALDAGRRVAGLGPYCLVSVSQLPSSSADRPVRRGVRHPPDARTHLGPSAMREMPSRTWAGRGEAGRSVRSARQTGRLAGEPARDRQEPGLTEPASSEEVGGTNR